jgi:predicted double-glycine peptidase
MQQDLANDIRIFLGLTKDANVLPVRIKKQINSFSCGAASMATVFAYWGIKMSVRTMSAYCATSFDVGTKFSNMVRVGKEAGFRVDVLQNTKSKEVKDYILSGIPLVPCWQFLPYLGETHYNVLIGYDVDHFVFAETARWDAWYTKITKQRFMKIWKNLEGGTWGDALAIYPKEI